MKGLKSPWVSGALAIIAIAVVAYQFKPMWDRRPRRRAVPAPAQVQAATPKQAPAQTTIRPTVLPRRPVTQGRNSEMLSPSSARIDRNYILSRIEEWVESPRRDPFMFSTAQQATGATAAEEAPSPVQQWVLKSIWRQTGERRAVVNDAVYKEGDEIQGFPGWRLERIDSDEVLFRGSNRVERLTFPYRQSPVLAPVLMQTNAPAASVPGPAAPAGRLGSGDAKGGKRKGLDIERILLAPQTK